jgi:hypothetical protein
MASERDEVLKEVIGEAADSQEAFASALTQGELTRQLALSHEHDLKMRRAELGWFGVVFGGEAHASIVVAFFVVVLGFVGAIGLWTVAYFTGRPEFWASEAHVSLAAATSALGYVFGRGSKDSPRH